VLFSSGWLCGRLFSISLGEPARTALQSRVEPEKSYDLSVDSLVRFSVTSFKSHQGSF